MATMTEVRVPDLGDFADVPVIELLVGPGDEIAVEDPVVVLESDKATMEVPTTAAGTVAEMRIAVGDTVSAGDVILTLSGDGAAPDDGDDGEDDGDGEDDAPTVAETPVSSPPPAPEARAPVDEEVAAPADAPTGDEAEPSPDDDDGGGGDGGGGGGGGGETIYAGPGARALARELGVDLGAVAGTGPKGRVTREDVTAAADGRPAAEAEAPAPAATAAAKGDERVPLSRIARIAGPILARNWATIPHVTQHDEADITDLEAFRVEVNAAHAEEGVKVTMVSLLMKACAAALREFPHFNATLDGDHLILRRRYDLGFAADTPNGLLVPVIRDVDRKGLLEIARDLTRLSGAARDGSIAAEDMRGGTFTISSLGGIGGTAFTPIINAPEVAILGVSRSAMRPVWIDGEFRPRLVLPLSLSYDHRAIDGAAGARFTTHLATLLSDPLKMLL